MSRREKALLFETFFTVRMPSLERTRCSRHFNKVYFSVLCAQQLIQLEKTSSGFLSEFTTLATAKQFTKKQLDLQTTF